MDAKAARQLAEKSQKKPITEILASIEKEASYGKTEMWYYKEMPKALRDELGLMGYNVGDTIWDQRENGHLTKITW